MVQGDANDFDGDGKGDLYVYRPSTAQFFVRKSSIPSGSPLPQSVAFTLGGESHLPVVLDWDGDALADIGVFSLVTGRWTIRLSTTGSTEVIGLGRGGDVPVPGDYLGGDADENRRLAAAHRRVVHSRAQHGHDHDGRLGRARRSAGAGGRRQRRQA